MESDIFPIDPFGTNQVILEGQRCVCTVPSCGGIFYVPPKIIDLVKSCPFCGEKLEKKD